MTRITASIKSSRGGALWLFVDRMGGRHMTADDLPIIRDEDKSEHVAYAITEDELIPIRDAIDSYLKQKEV